MILFFLGFVCGVWLLQSAASLSFLSFNVTLACISSVIFLTFFIYQLHGSTRASLRALQHFLIVFVSLAVGFLWAAMLAKNRLEDELPHAWEQKPIEIVGVVVSLPVHTERAVRFNFEVEKTLTKDAQVPYHISLMQYKSEFSYKPQGASKVPPSEEFRVGQRWQLIVKLKRPHGTYNPHCFDFESWALSENIRATGTVKVNSTNHKLTEFVWQPSTIVEKWREKTVNRINHVLAGQPYAAEISALVAGDDSAINANNWLVYLRTGVNHLMSISGLHITIMLYTVVQYYLYY